MRRLFLKTGTANRTGKRRTMFALMFVCVLFLLCACDGKTVSNGTDSSAGIGTDNGANGVDSSYTSRDDVGSAASDNGSGESSKDGSEKMPDVVNGNSDANTDEADKSAEALDKKSGVSDELIISEVFPTNHEMAKHNDRYFDMIELLNVSDHEINLSNYSVADSKKHAGDYKLPDEVLAPGEYYLIYCTGQYYCSEAKDVPFKLSSQGEKVYLFGADNSVADMLKYPRLPKNTSYGRNKEAEERVFVIPTPGEANGSGVAGIAESPKVNVAPGFYGEGVAVSFECSGEVRYTLDGTKPTEKSKKWDGNPIAVDKTCAIRAFAVQDGMLDSFDVAFNYFINEPEYELDVVMMSFDESDYQKIVENPKSNHRYPGNVALFSNGELQFELDCGFRVSGCTSRKYTKKSLSLFFDTDFGPSKLEYPLFENLDITEFNSITLRSGSQDNEAAMIRDEYISSLSISDGYVKDVLVQAYRPVNVYYNNEYQGIYYIRERVSDEMVASHYDCEPEEVTIVEQNTEVKSGKAAKEWQDLWKFISENSLKEDKNYNHVKEIVNLESVADYYIIQLWSSNIDMDNVRVFKAGDDKWRYLLYDLDLTLFRDVSGTAEREIGKLNKGWPSYNALIYRLLENGEFAEMFCDRLEHMAQGPYSDEKALAAIEEFRIRLDHDMQYNCERWNGVDDTMYDHYYVSYKSWCQNIEYLKRKVTGRAAALMKDIGENKNIDRLKNADK